MPSNSQIKSLKNKRLVFNTIMYTLLSHGFVGVQNISMDSIFCKAFLEFEEKKKII